MQHLHIKDQPAEYQLGNYEWPRAINPFSYKYDQPILSVLRKARVDGFPKFKCHFVYLIGLGTRGPIKIGKAKNPKDRLSCLQAANPNQLTLLAIIYDPNDIWEERLHNEFATARIRGEWFKRDRHLQDFLYWLRKFQIKTSVKWSDWYELHKSQKLG